MPSRIDRVRILGILVVVALLIASWQVAIVLAQGPQPNPLASGSTGTKPGAAPSVDLTANGPAAAIHGDPAAGRLVFANNCASCHGDRGLGNVANPDSDDGTVPALNPIDPGFYEQSQGDPGAYARGIDLFVQHGSRPAGESPQLSMPAWGDQNLMSTADIANVEAYVMQLNGVYWPDRWAPPAEVRVDSTQTGDVVTYEITIVNQGSGELTNVDLSDSLPTGLTYLGSGLPAIGQNPGRVNGNVVTWNSVSGVPQGGTLGPFVITAQLSGSQVPVNIAQTQFSWTNAAGARFSSSAVSNPSLPKQAASNTPVPAAVSTPVAASSAAPTMVMPVASGVATSVPVTSVPATPEPVAPTATPVPVAAAPASFSVQIVQPSTAANSWGYSPATITIHIGDTITWTNQGPLAHTVTALDGSFDSGLFDAGGTWSMTFNTAGTYNYTCTPHPWMKGTVVVESASQ